MEENKNVILGIYIMGIKKRPELANKPCVVQYLENDKRVVVSITVNEMIENISIDRSRIVNVRNVPRTILSQNEFKDTSINESDLNVLAAAFMGSYGGLVGTLVNQSGLLKSSNSGAVTYTSLNELHITYIDEENLQRDLMIQTDLDPTNFMNLINNQG